MTRPRWLQHLIDKQAEKDYKGHPLLRCEVKPDEQKFKWRDPSKITRPIFKKSHESQDKTNKN